MINRIIASYLAEGRRLVVPRFGAFIHKDGDGVVVFVPFLKKDDGVLTGLLNQEYGLNEADAHGVIDEYMAQVGKSIAERGAFTVEGVGNLKPDGNGILFLIYGPGAAAGISTPAAQEVKTTTVPKDKTDTTAVPPPAAERPAVVPPVTSSPVRPAQQSAMQSPAESVPHSAVPAAPSPRQAQPAFSASSGYGSPNRHPQGRPVQRPPQGTPPSGARRPVPPRQNKADRLMLIAMLAAVIALAAIVYSVVSSPAGPSIEPVTAPVVRDSLSAETPPTAPQSE